MKRIASVFFSAVFLFGLLNLTAQEKQVPFFAEQDVVTIEKGYAKKMAFFQEYENFVEARLFKLADGTFALEVFYEKGESLFKDRKVMTSGEKDLFIQSMLGVNIAEAGVDTVPGVQAPPASVAPKVVLNQKGRPAMLVMNTLTGLGYYGWTVPVSLGIEDEKAFVGMYMLSAATAFYLPYKITENKDVSLGQASFTFYGQSRFGLHGFLLASSLSKRVNYDDYVNYDDPNYMYNEYDYQRYDRAREKQDRAYFSMSILGSVAGGIAGYNLAGKWDYSGGSTSIFQMGGDVGTISGLLLSDVFGFWDKPENNAMAATTLGMSIAGMGVGKYLGDTKSFTLGDAIVYRSTILASCMVPVTVIRYFDPDDFTPYAIGGLAGIAAGGYLGWKSTLNRDFSASEGVFVALGELAGGLLGAGLGFLVAPDIDDLGVILTTSTLGALGGYALMYGPMSKKAALATKDKFKLDVGFNPSALLVGEQALRNPAYAGLGSLVNVKVRF
jgi:hypothetical protein